MKISKWNMKKDHRFLRFLISIFAPGYHLHRGKVKKKNDIDKNTKEKIRKNIEALKEAYEGKQTGGSNE